VGAPQQNYSKNLYTSPHKNQKRANPMPSEIVARIDILPDNDNFLPRYLTVQLLGILAKTLGNHSSSEKPETSKETEAFIDAFKANELFNPLTFAVFWSENVTQVMQEHLELLNKTDTYGHGPLTLALAKEDFALAHTMVETGAQLLIEDKLVLEIALTSLIQRNENVMPTILAGAAAEDQIWVQEYLACLQSYVQGHAPSKKYHDVLNPPIRHFGQVLDTLGYFNGLPSHYGFLSPSIEILTVHLQNYLKELGTDNAQTMFNSIATAYKFTRDQCKYYGNLPTVGNAANALAAQIAMINKSHNRERVVVLFGGWAGNAVTIAFINQVLIFSNLGTGGNPDSGTKIFNIANPNAISAEWIDQFIRGLGNATSARDILVALSTVVDPEPIFTLKQTLNPIDNCIYVNPRAIIQGILLVSHAYKNSDTLSTQLLTSLMPTVDQMYKSYLNSLYRHSSEDLAQFVRNGELIRNRRIECCAIALDYINQHYQEPEALPRCIALKNALEFVGLKDFYINNVNPDAKAAIQQVMIHQQEAAAMEVIELEYKMAAEAASGRK
jgi:hypothetical protein